MAHSDVLKMNSILMKLKFVQDGLQEELHITFSRESFEGFKEKPGAYLSRKVSFLILECGSQ